MCNDTWSHEYLHRIKGLSREQSTLSLSSRGPKGAEKSVYCINIDEPEQVFQGCSASSFTGYDLRHTRK
jgi:hypothetical protein